MKTYSNPKIIKWTHNALGRGFIDPPASAAAAERKFIQKYGQELLDILNECQISTTRDQVNEIRYNAKEIRDKYTEHGGETLSGVQFSQALRNYCVLAPDVEQPVEYWRSNGKRYFLFYGENKRDLSNI